VKTSVPTGATIICTIDDGNTNIYSATSASTGAEMTFTKTIANPHLWNGTIDPHLYTVTLEIYKDNELYHRFVRPYGLRYYEYVINDITKVGTAENPYTGFLLNGSPYLLRGCCMHDDIEGRANALTETDYNNTFATIQELGLNFLRLAHYPHPKEVYDRCDALGIVVQTEGPCVSKLQSTMPEDYYIHLTGQYTDMVNQHYNHPCIFFWGLSNETTTDDKAFAKEKIEGYTTLIKSLDSERMVGYVLAQGTGQSPSAYYNDPAVDWFGCNIYVGWYDSPNSNTPTGQINTRLANTVGRVGKPMAYSEYGCGGTQRCHSDDYLTTTTRGNNPRHDIEYMMWLHEGHIATIKQYPQLMFTSQWQLFDIAVANRNEGYTVCLDGENTSIDDELRRLNDKGLVERDHVTKKDPFYLYKAWWNPTPFVHICGKDYTKINDRKIKCYTNETGTATLYVNGASVATTTVTDYIAEFTANNFSSGDVIRVDVGTSSDTFTFE
jgi:beta-galactosidase